MKKLLFAFGTRPEAIKLAPVIIKAKQTNGIHCSVVVTAQHRQMLDQVLKVFNIIPDIDLNIMTSGQTLNELSSKIIKGMDEVIELQKPDWLIVHGDTTTTLMASLSAFHRQIPVAHVEAGLRTFDLKMPFPEEMNRQAVSVLSSLHFAPTERAYNQLLAEGRSAKSVKLVGNTVVDSILWVLKKFADSPSLILELDEMLPNLEPSKKTILLTTHRRENFNGGLESICHAVAKVTKMRTDIQIVIPLHLNPIVQDTVRNILGDNPQVRIIEPLGYLPFIRLMQRSDLILTDSGGLQEEAPTLNKFVLILRSETERPEALDSGCAKLVGTQQDKIVDGVLDAIDRAHSSAMKNPFGDGMASDKIIQSFLS